MTLSCNPIEPKLKRYRAVTTAQVTITITRVSQAIAFPVIWLVVSIAVVAICRYRDINESPFGRAKY
jgi:hypothetical protein